MKLRRWKQLVCTLMTVFIVLLGAGTVWLRVSGRLSTVAEVQALVSKCGPLGPLILTGFQAMQVVVPVLPGFAGCGVGTALFGTAAGFWCNYTGICLGSLLSYWLARKYGEELLLLVFPKKQYTRWRSRVEDSGSYGWFLFAATLLPLFPDDLLCYLSGLLRMDWKRFTIIILLGKPWCILAYCLGFSLL